MSARFGFGACIGGGKDPAAPEDPFADPRCFVGAVRYDCFVFRIVFAKIVIQGIEGYAVIDIAGGHMNAENEIVLVAGRMCFIRKAFSTG